MRAKTNSTQKSNHAIDASLKSEDLKHIFYSQLFHKNIMLPPHKEFFTTCDNLSKQLSKSSS